MSAKIYYWNLLVLFGVFCQGTISTFSEKDIDESSELIVDRQKRVINRAPGGDIREPIRNVPYVVFLKIVRTNNTCVGVILSTHIVLTISKCVQYELVSYRVYSGTTRLSVAGRSLVHHVTEKIRFPGNHPNRPDDGIALIAVTPPFTYSTNTRNIELYQGHIQPGLHGTVSGWGCNAEGHPGTEHKEHLRSITVPIINSSVCARLYADIMFPISESDICTFDETGNKYCGAGDVGAPLVIAVDSYYKLVGIHLWNGPVVGQKKPDVFANLMYSGYKNWIAQSIHLLNKNYRTQRHNH